MTCTNSTRAKAARFVSSSLSTHHGRFVTLVPHETIVEVIELETGAGRALTWHLANRSEHCDRVLRERLARHRTHLGRDREPLFRRTRRPFIDGSMLMK